MKPVLYFFLLIYFIPQLSHAQHPNAHAHNDYTHANPLHDALKNGFTSIEADIFLIEDELIVSHDYPQNIEWERSLTNLYLDPLLKLSLKNGGRIFAGYDNPIFLLIDIKGDANETWLKLREVLNNYESLISTSTNDAPIKVILSGNRPIESILQETNPPAFLDGRPADLGKGISNNVMPWVSENYFKVINSFNMDAPTDSQKERIKSLAEKVHSEGKLLRLWASPDKKEVWDALLECGADLINADDLEGLNQYLLEIAKKGGK